jgi:hypothetical protein
MASPEKLPDCKVIFNDFIYHRVNNGLVDAVSRTFDPAQLPLRAKSAVLADGRHLRSTRNNGHHRAVPAVRFVPFEEQARSVDHLSKCCKIVASRSHRRDRAELRSMHRKTDWKSRR